MAPQTPGRWYYLAIVATILLVLVPYPTGPANWIGEIVWQLVVPVSEPFERVSAAVRPPPEPFDASDPERRALLAEIEYLKRAIAKYEVENDTLRLELAALRELAGQGRTESYFPLKVGRAGTSPLDISGAFRVNAGTTQGVSVGTLAFLPPTQLVGFVSDVTPFTATIVPITSRESDFLRVRIDVPGIDFSNCPVGTLEPNGDGTLSGLFQATEIAEKRPGKNAAVRLDDDKFDEAHTGLLVGRVQSIEPYDPSPLHVNVTVKPSAGDLFRVQVLYLLIPQVNRTARPNGDEGSGGG